MSDQSPVIMQEKLAPKKLPDPKQNILPSSGPIRSLKEELQDHLKSLYTLLTDTLKAKPLTVPSNSGKSHKYHLNNLKKRWKIVFFYIVLFTYYLFKVFSLTKVFSTFCDIQGLT